MNTVQKTLSLKLNSVMVTDYRERKRYLLQKLPRLDEARRKKNAFLLGPLLCIKRAICHCSRCVRFLVIIVSYSDKIVM